jgi:hypothetical protein
MPDNSPTGATISYVKKSRGISGVARERDTSPFPVRLVTTSAASCGACASGTAWGEGAAVELAGRCSLLLCG